MTKISLNNISNHFNNYYHYFFNIIKLADILENDMIYKTPI